MPKCLEGLENLQQLLMEEEVTGGLKKLYIRIFIICMRLR
jgi:hypothetical protein